MRTAARLSLLPLAATVIVALAGCTGADTTAEADLVAGKQLFVQKCGSCHVLNRAGTKGTQGPNLDTSLAVALEDGFGETAVRGMVREMIDLGGAATAGTDTPSMPQDIVTGDDARDVAAYVAESVGKPGEDEGLLATAVAPAGSDEAAVAENGVLTIAADPNGQLLFVNSTAEAPAGELTLTMPNESGVPHNIAIEGKGSSDVVESGESSFTAMFEPGTYTYICEVEGHEAAGMVGELTVKAG